jgi:hypothetical protein
MTSSDTYAIILDTWKVNAEERCFLFIKKTYKKILPRFGGRKLITKKISSWLYMPKIKKINGILTMVAPST